MILCFVSWASRFIVFFESVYSPSPPHPFHAAQESVLYSSPIVRQALLTTVSRDSIARALTEELPRPLWVLGGEGGKTIIELVLLNLVRTSLRR